MVDQGRDTDVKDFFFDLSFLGDIHKTEEYTLKAFGQSLKLSLIESQNTKNERPDATVIQPTHHVKNVRIKTNVIQLIRVLGPKTEANIPSLVLTAIYTPETDTVYTVEDIATSMLFLHPQITVLTAEHALTVVDHINESDSFDGLVEMIRYKKGNWNTPRVIKNEQNEPLLRSDGTPHFTYEPDLQILNLTAQPAGEAKLSIYNNPTLQNIRWSLQPGISCIEKPAAASPKIKSTAGYHYKIQDTGPHFGVSIELISVSDNGELTFEVTNNYIRHLSIFIGFIGGDGKTPIELPIDAWREQLRGVTENVYNAWLKELAGGAADYLLGDGTYNFVNTVSPEMTFMGVPVSSSSQTFTFQLPTDKHHSISKVKILCGSLGLNSDINADPLAARIGLIMTCLIDLLLPTVALAATVGTESNALFDEIFKDVKFLAPTAYSAYTVIKDLLDDSPDLGNDAKEFLSALGDRLVSKVLAAPDVAAKLAIYFGVEEAEESIPYVGWALKALAVEATVEQLAQTYCEVITSPRIVEFDVTVSMDALITLEPDMSDHPKAPRQFAETAHSYTITAQYSDIIAHTFSGEISDPKVEKIEAHLYDLPVGGEVTFIVAIYSREGHLVGKGTTATIPNAITEGKGVLAATMLVKELLYPLTSDTRYQHTHLMQYTPDPDPNPQPNRQAHGYAWKRTETPPGETAEALGDGTGDVVEKLAGITLNADLGILAQAWQAPKLNIPSIDDVNDVQLFAFQNLGYGTDPSAGYMFTPAGYSQAPRLAYMRTMAHDAKQSAYFFVDPTGDETSGYHLRQIVPLTDHDIPLDSEKRLFDLSRERSWGRFNILPDSIALHSNGYVVAITNGYPTLQILRLPQQAQPSDKAPWAHLSAGPGIREGLLDDPRLVAIAPNQTILVLEQGNHRIQAFSRGGHPVKAFSDTDCGFWIPLQNPKDVTYLAMSVEVKGYIYVLYHAGNGYEADQFQLDIYTPTGKRLVSQQGLNAGSLTVDLWRNLYTQNYQTILGPGQRPEPSISEYRPQTPATPLAGRDGIDLAESGTWTSLGNWTLWAHGLGKLTAYGHYFDPTMYAGGFVVAGLGYPYNYHDDWTSYNSWDSWNLYADLENRILSLRSATVYHGAHWYLNSHATGDGEAIRLWYDPIHYSSNALTPEQQFQLYNLGKGNVAFKALHGAYQGQFITSKAQGWYPHEWKLGNGTLTFANVTKPGEAQTFTVSGSQLPILRLTNSARDCNLSKENLTGLDLSGADFTSAVLHQTIFKGVRDVSKAQFEKAQLQGAVLDGLNLADALGFEHADFSGTDLTRIAASPGAVLNHAWFKNKANLTGVKLAGAHLQYADFSTAVLDGADLSGADLTGAILDGASLKGTILKGAILHGARFDNVDLSAAVFDENPDFSRNTSNRTTFHKSTLPFSVISNNWSYLDLTGATINGIPKTIEKLQAQHALLPDHMDLSGHVLKKADFEGAQMYWFQGVGTDLREANCRNAKLKGAKLTKANLSMVDLTDAYLLDETKGGYTLEDKQESAVVSDAFLINTRLDGAHCDGVDFSGSLFLTYEGYSTKQVASAKGAQLNLAKFDNAKLLQAVFDQAELAGSTFDVAVCVKTSFKDAQLIPQTQSPHKDSSMWKSDIRGADFSRANMDGLNMMDATVSSENGVFKEHYKGFDDDPIFLDFKYGVTVLGNTTHSTTCPSGDLGPCHIS